MTIELVKFEDIAALMGLADDVVVDYPDFGVIITSVTAAIENYLGRYLEQIERTETVYLHSTYRQMIALKGLPVASVSAVTDTGEDSDITTDASITEYGIRLTSARRNTGIQVVYTGGYAASAVPADITRAALLQCAYEYQGKDQIGASMVSNEGGSVSRPSLQLLPEVKRVLDPHKHPMKVN